MEDGTKHFFLSAPKPSGKYSIGKTSFGLCDTKRKEWHEKKRDAYRELMVHVWYPAIMTLDRDYKHVDIESDYYLKMKALCQKKLHLSDSQFHERWNFSIFSVPNMPIAPLRFPVILFSPGFEEPSEAYSLLLEHFVSHGYIVVGIDHPYFCSFTSFPDGRILTGGLEGYLQNRDKENQDYAQLNKYFVRELQTNLADIQFALDVITNPKNNPIKPQILAQMDWEKIGVMGHSCGGACSVEMARIDPRIKAAVNLDGVFFGAFSTEEVEKPILTLCTEKFLMDKAHATDKEASALGLSVFALNEWWDSLMEERFAFCKNMGAFGFEVVLKHFGHQSIINHVLLQDESIRYLVLGANVEKEVGTIHPHQAILIPCDLLLTFFNKHL